MPGVNAEHLHLAVSMNENDERSVVLYFNRTVDDWDTVDLSPLLVSNEVWEALGAFHKEAKQVALDAKP